MLLSTMEKRKDYLRKFNHFDIFTTFIEREQAFEAPALKYHFHCLYHIMFLLSSPIMFTILFSRISSKIYSYPIFCKQTSHSSWLLRLSLLYRRFYAWSSIFFCRLLAIYCCLQHVARTLPIVIKDLFGTLCINILKNSCTHKSTNLLLSKVLKTSHKPR